MLPPLLQIERNASAEVRSFCNGGHLDRALYVLFHKVKWISTYLVADLLVLVLGVCCRHKTLPHIVAIYDGIYQLNLEVKGCLGDHLITAFAKCGAADDARHVFFSLPCRSSFAWTAMIACLTDSGKCQDALKLYHIMQMEHVEPSPFIFAALFKACACISDLHEGQKLHIEAQSNGLGSNVFVGSTLVSMYGKCGRIEEAEKVFVELLERNVVSWNAMLAAYTNCGEAAKALKLYRQMQEEGEHPNHASLAAVLHACGSYALKLEGGIEEWSLLLNVGQALHSDACRRGFILDYVIRSTLVTMYGNCGAVAQAMNVFNEFHECNVVCWSAMLSVLLDQGQAAGALLLYRQTQVEGVGLDHQTFVIAIQACNALMTEETVIEGRTPTLVPLLIGQALHVDVQKKGFSSNVFVGNALVSMYGKWEIGILEAEKVFVGLPQHNVISWTAMLSVYVEHGLGKKALHLYRQMEEQRISSNHLTFVVLLQACGMLYEEEGKVMRLEIGRTLHAEALKKGFTSNIFVVNALLSMYSICGTLQNSEDMFQKLSQVDTVSCNTMLSAYVEHGQVEKALLLYKQMQEEGVNPDLLTFATALQACSTLVRTREEQEDDSFSNSFVLEIGEALYADAAKEGFASDVMVCNALMSLYGKCGCILRAKEIFDCLSKSNTVSWNTMISAFHEAGKGEEALELYNQIEKQGLTLDEVTLVSVMQACIELGNLELILQLHFNCVSSICDPTPLLQYTIVHSYGTCASLEDAKAVFAEIGNPDITSWNVYVGAHAQEGSDCTSLHSADEVESTGLPPNEVTFLLALSACCHAGRISEGIAIFESLSLQFELFLNSKQYAVVVGLLGHAGQFSLVGDMLMGMPMHANFNIWLCLLGACQIHHNMQMGKVAFGNVMNLNPKEAAAYVLLANICTSAV